MSNQPSKEVQSFVNKLENADNPFEMVDILYGGFDSLSDKHKEELLMFNMAGGFPQLDDFAKMLHESMYSNEGIANYTTVKLLIESAKFNLFDEEYTLFASKLEDKLSSMSDEDFQIPEKMSVVALQAYYDYKGSASEFKISVKNPFKATEESVQTKNSQNMNRSNISRLRKDKGM